MARQMKDSGVEWIGEIPENWELPKVKNLFDIGRGRVISQLDLEDSGYPVYSSQTKNNGCLGYIRTYDFDRSQLTWTTDGANAGTVFLREGKHNCTNICGTLMPKNENNNLRYMKYALEYIAIFHKRADTNGYKIMNNEMAEIKITLPPRFVQDIIADFLDEKVGEIDFVIARTKETIEDYKKYKQAIITDAVTKGLNPDVEMKDSGIEWIGDVPKYWKIFRIKNIAKEIGDGLHSTPEYDGNGDVFFINGNNIGDEYLNIKENTNKLNETEREKYKLPLLNENTIMIALNGATYGKTSFYNGEKVLLGKSAGYITLSETCNKRYVRYFLQSYSAKYFMALSLNGTTIQNLSLNTLNNFYITFPDMEEQQRIVEFLDIKCSEIDKLLAKKEELLADLEDYKKSFIYEYVTGKKEVE